MHTWMKSTRNIARSIRYPLTDKAVQRTERVAGLMCGGGIVDTGSKDGIVMQFNHVLALGDRSYRKRYSGTYPIQGYIRTLSFSAREISPDDPEWVEKALNVTNAVMNNIAPDCQWIAVVQKDGKAGLVHVHVVQNVLHTSSLHPVSGRETSYDIFRKQTEAVMESQGIELDAGRRRGKAAASEAKKRQDHAREISGYSWMQDLKLRIQVSIAQTTASGEFEDALTRNGVSVSRKTKRGWTFVLADSAEPEWIGKKASYDRFDDDFSMSALNRRFKENYQEMVSQKAERRLPDISNVISAPEGEYQLAH